jgi:pimeloyl-ACP methyl ester carboxylesterase
LILIGELEEIIPLQEAREMAAFIPEAELEIIPGATHTDVPKTKGLLHKLVRDFIDRSTP